MKLIKQTVLAYQGGNSDKVYEVDLCEVGTDQYVVNFRYGRRGTALKEGSKTPLPVDRAKADQLFDSLVQSKLKKGYYDTHADGAAITSQTTEADVKSIETASPEIEAIQDPRAQAILYRLATYFQRADGVTAAPKTDKTSSSLLSLFKKWDKKAPTQPNPPSQRKAWMLDRVIWRAGELRIAEAEPYLLRLITATDHERNYCIVYALGRCGSEQALSHLQNFYATQGLPDRLRRLAGAALLMRLPSADSQAMQAQYLADLPKAITEVLPDNSIERLNETLDTCLQAAKPDEYEVLTQLYQASVPCSQQPLTAQQHLIRTSLLEILRIMPLRPPFFKRLRHIFKLAEYLEDFVVYALLAYRFEQEQALFYPNDWGCVSFSDEQGRYHYLYGDELRRVLASPTAKLAYGEKTRHYLRRRVWRILRRLGEVGSPQYVELATQVLLNFSDADASQTSSNTTERWVNQQGYWRRVTRTSHWDAFAVYWSFNQVLYRHSPRYTPTANGFWRCQGDYRPGGTTPTANEAAFPELWQQAPEKLLHLLQHSHCYPVHEFAVKALRHCSAFCAVLPLETLIGLLHSLYPDTAQLAFELAEPHYNPAQPQRELVLVALSCVAAPARAAAQAWVEQGRVQFLQDSEFLSQLIGSTHPDTRAFAQTFLQSASLNDRVAQALLGRLVSELLVMSEAQLSRAIDISTTLRQVLGPQLRLLGMPVLADLLGSELLAAQTLAAETLFNYHEPSAIPESLLHTLLEAQHSSLRGIAMRILARFSDAELLQRNELLAVLAMRPQPELRAAAAGLIQRLLPQSAAFGEHITLLLIGRLLLPKPDKDAAADVVKLLKQHCQPYWHSVQSTVVWRLLRARAAVAQEVGGLLLSICTQPEDFSIKQLVKLADHEILSIRDAARTMCLAQLPRLRAEMFVTVKLLDAHWPDSREFAFKLFTEQFSKADLPPDVLVSICDSVKPEIQQLGRQLLTQYFSDADGTDYLLRLSEHPGHDMQLFATHYLERFACDNPDRLHTLTPYFLSVLSRVNKGKVAKQRIYQFLEAEALKSQAAAAVVAPIVARQSATMAVGDKAATIRIMAKIQQQYPQLALPLKAC